MSERLSFSNSIAIAYLIAIGAMTFAMKASAQTAPCPAGTQQATQADLSAMQAAGIPDAIVGMCWNPSDPNIGTAAGAAKQFIQQHATKSTNVSCLNTQFSQQLANMIKAVPSNLGTVIIDSGYRSPQEQANLPSAATRVGACGSYHQYGLAADFNDSSKQVVQWVRANASQYGLTVIGNATTGCFSSGFCDPAHVQEAGSLPSRNQCGICSSQGMGTLSAPANTAPAPNESYFYSPPSSGAQIPAGYCLVSTQPIIYTPCGSMNPSQQPALPTSIAQPGAAVQPVQRSALPTPTITPRNPLTTAIATSAASSILSNLFDTMPIATPPTATSATQAINIITNLGTTTSASISLDQNLQTIVTDLIPGNQPTPQKTDTSSNTSQTSYPQDTFSPDNYQQYSSSSTSGLDQILRPLKNALQNFLSFLQSL